PSTSSALLAISHSGTLIWSVPLQNSASSPTVIGTDGTIYLADGFLFKAITPSGLVKWTYTGLCAPVIGQGDVIYCSSSNSVSSNSVFALTSSGTLLWTVQLSSGFSRLLPILAPDGTLYAGMADTALVYAIETSSLGLASSSWPRWRQNNQNTGLAAGQNSG